MPTLASSPNNFEIHPVRVLLVDDSAHVRSELRQLLELSGVMEIVGEAGDGLEAVRRAGELTPDAIVMDIEMPIMDGCEATRQIKALTPAPRIVILSVHAGLAEQKALESGADSFVVKGASYQVLVNAILGKDGKTNNSEKGEKS